MSSCISKISCDYRTINYRNSYLIFDFKLGWALHHSLVSLVHVINRRLNLGNDLESREGCKHALEDLVLIVTLLLLLGVFDNK